MTLKGHSDYHEAAKDLAAETKDRDPKFSDKEKINLEIYAESHSDGGEREKYLELRNRKINCAPWPGVRKR